MSQQGPFTLDVDGRRLWGSVSLPDRRGPAPTVVICHGFKGFMDWGFFPSLAELLAQRGYCALRFNFSGSGMRPGDDAVTDPDAFRSASFSRDVSELQRVLQAVGDTIAPGRADRHRIALVGHSRGGGTALLAAAGAPRLAALVTWAAVSTFDRLSQSENDVWRRDGEVPVVNARTGQRLMVGREVLDDLVENRLELDLEQAAASRRAPWLIIHGTDDESVPLTEGRLLAASAARPVELLEIDGGDHTFGARHPFAGPTPQLVEAMNATQRWLRRHLPVGDDRSPPSG